MHKQLTNLYFYIEKRMGVLNERLFTITFGWKHSPYLKKKWSVSCTFQYFKISMGTYKYIWISTTSGILSTKYYLLCIYFFSWTMHPDKYSGLIAFFLYIQTYLRRHEIQLCRLFVLSGLCYFPFLRNNCAPKILEK